MEWSLLSYTNLNLNPHRHPHIRILELVLADQVVPHRLDLVHECPHLRLARIVPTSAVDLLYPLLALTLLFLRDSLSFHSELHFMLLEDFFFSLFFREGEAVVEFALGVRLVSCLQFVINTFFGKTLFNAILRQTIVCGHAAGLAEGIQGFDLMRLHGGSVTLADLGGGGEVVLEVEAYVETIDMLIGEEMTLDLFVGYGEGS